MGRKRGLVWHLCPEQKICPWAGTTSQAASLEHPVPGSCSALWAHRSSVAPRCCFLQLLGSHFLIHTVILTCADA
ncbi:hypothetical protein PBY51_024629 [Eleginops maclovinus]|uniref:Uncharacterized protein n=1 Tax=Eleginops maclovinus TaxID=56733 RepID=A0AAN7XTT9_ELEMC|nr:hypothetical protein PBY51_024629 [Eleginops maclovinus]